MLLLTSDLNWRGILNTEIIIDLAAIVILITLSSFFSSAETALTTVSHIRVRSLIEEGNKRAVTLNKVISQPAKMLSAILIGNNIVNMAVSALTTSVTIHIWGNIYVGAATGLLTLFILLFGEITPKTLASLHAEKTALSYAPVIYVVMVLFTPVISIVNMLERLIMRILHIDPDARNNIMTENELRTLVNVGQEDGVIEKEEKQMIYNVFDFGDSTARDVMVPRIDMDIVDVDSTESQLLEIFRLHRHTRFPVYEDSTDNIIGTINMKDLLLNTQESELSIHDILREPYFTYEHKPTADLLLEMRKASVNLAIVLDEYGATAGLVTLEDLLEEIVGEIRDEYDEYEQEDLITVQPGKEYLASGSARLDDINEALGLSLNSTEYDSIGGYIIEQLDSLPTSGQKMILEDGTLLAVDEFKGNRIKTVHIWLPDKNEGADGSALPG